MSQVLRNPISVPPGVVRTSTEVGKFGRWYDANLVRWVGSNLRPVNGWSLLSTVGEIEGTVRKIHTWSDNEGIIRNAFLTESNLYILEGGSLTDITPVDFVSPGENLIAGGYGNNLYGKFDYGEPRPDRVAETILGNAYSLGNWGEDLLAMSSADGRLLRWSPGDTVAAVVPNAPLANRLFVVTPERHVVLFGLGGNFRRFGWCDQEDIEEWDFDDVTNTAGAYEVDPSSHIVTALSASFGVIFFTASQIRVSRYVGVPFIYTNELVSDGSAPISVASLTEAQGDAVWMAGDGVWKYDGNEVVPIQCTVWDWIKDNLNVGYGRFNAFSMNLGVHTEVWWFLPIGEAAENNVCVYWDFVANWWSMGYLDRSAGAASGYLNFPIMASGDKLYYHENGDYYTDLSELPYVTLSSFNLERGARYCTIHGGVPDHGEGANTVTYEVIARYARTSDAEPPARTTGPVLTDADGKLRLRITGRDFSIKLQTAFNGAPPWSFGELMLKYSSRGHR